MRIAFIFCLTSFLAILPCARAQTLHVTYGVKGVQTIAYGSTTLEDISANAADTFHIWHMKITDLNGKVLGSGQYGWGETNAGEAWDAAHTTETYTFSWGRIAVQFAQKADDLNMVVTETNNAGSNIILDGAEIFPFALHFPQDPTGFSGYTQYAITTTGPGVSFADFGAAIVTAVAPDASNPLYTGWKTAGPRTYTPIMTTTAPDGMAVFLPNPDRPVYPGKTFTYTISVRFTPEGGEPALADAYASFARTYPNQMSWTDRRIIGTAYLASSPAANGNQNKAGGYPNNPRRYFNDPSININTSAGLLSFQERVLQQATGNVTNARRLGAQGIITWDIEGEQYPQSTSYVCSPDKVASIAPEIESKVLDTASPYNGQKLDDAYFKTMTDAGLKVGVCLRPQVFTPSANGTAAQIFLDSNASIIANLEEKIKAAHSRWGVTIFYVDSTVAANGGTLDPAIFQRLITDFPTLLFIPEESTPRYYAYSAPFYSFIFHTTLGTDPSVYNYYPKAFGANLVNDVSANTLAKYVPQLTQSVSHGDLLMGHADYWQANNPTLVQIYQAAAASASRHKNPPRGKPGSSILPAKGRP